MTDFQRQSLDWHRCFRSLHAVSANVSADTDRYLKAASNQRGWVDGPNSQFLAIARAMETAKWGQYSAWHLMEFDNVPRQPLWLTSLQAEVQARAPFAILGSLYRGDMWARMGPWAVKDEVALHINGNAVYNSSSPHLRRLVNALADAMAGDFLTYAFDVWMTQYCLDHKLNFQDIGYFGDSRSMGNYAGTVMTDAYTHGESLVHGGHWYDDWDASEPLTLVTSDWGLADMEGVPMLSTFISDVLAGDHPFRYVVAVRPGHAIASAPKYERLTAKGLAIAIREVPRTEDTFWDWCAAPVATRWFAYSNVYFSHNVRADYLMTRGDKAVVAPYIPADWEQCDARCTASMARAALWAGRPVTRHYEPTTVLFHTAARLHASPPMHHPCLPSTPFAPPGGPPRSSPPQWGCGLRQMSIWLSPKDSGEAGCTTPWTSRPSGSAPSPR